MKELTEHEKRIQQELKLAGVSKFGMRKFTVKYLPKIIHKNEHVKGVVYGRYNDNSGMPLNEGALVATDLRIIFLDHKPGFTRTDEITYEVVSGITTITTLFSSVSLHTKLGDFVVRFANSKCAAIFVSYVEERRLETVKNQTRQ